MDSPAPMSSISVHVLARVIPVRAADVDDGEDEDDSAVADVRKKSAHVGDA